MLDGAPAALQPHCREYGTETRSPCVRDVRIAAQAKCPDDRADGYLFIYAIVREDLEMPPGKLAMPSPIP